MRTERLLETIDTHTAGEPTRMLVGGLEWRSKGESVRDQRNRFAAEYDWVRELLMEEPRGHSDMFGAIPVEPSTEDADLGLIFMDHDIFGDMCGHATIGVVTAFIETGHLDPQETVVIETPAGLVETHPETVDGQVKRVRMRNVPSFVDTQVTVDGPDGSTVPVSIVYAGDTFGVVDATDLDVRVDSESVDTLLAYARLIREQVNERVEFIHPITDQRDDVNVIEIYQGRPDGASRSFVLFGEQSIDRSPCGTGVCAKMTLQYSRGELDIGETYRQESIIGTRFEGRLVETRSEDGVKMVVPEIAGSAYIIGKNTYLVDPDDPITGFSI